MEYRIGQVAERTGIAASAIRYYEREGLIPRARRSVSGYRQYDRAAIRRIQAIKRAQSLGFTLREIRELMKLRSTRAGGPKLVAFSRRKIEEIDAKIEDLQAMRTQLSAALEGCECGGKLSRCDVLAGLQSSDQDNPN